MNTYYIEHKIQTTCFLGLGTKKKRKKNHINFRNFNLDFDKRNNGGGWIAYGKIKDKNRIDAINNFRSNLGSIIRKISLITHSHFSFVNESFLIFQKNENYEKHFLYRFSESKRPIGLNFGSDEKKAFLKFSIKDGKLDNLLYYIDEYHKTDSFIGKLGILYSALEAICNKKNAKGECDKCGYEYIREGFDHKEMKLILTKSLHKKHFGPNGIRNKLFHGEITKYIYSLDKSDIDELYKKLINYISSKYKVKLKENIKFIGRNENSTAIYQIREFKSLKLGLKLGKIEKNTKVISKKISINGYQKISSANTFYNKPTSP